MRTRRHRRREQARGGAPGRAAAMCGLAALLAVLAVCGCAAGETRIVEALPPPAFMAPPGDPEPTIRPDADPAWRDFAHPARDWRWIVIHHSATPGGGAHNFDVFHRETRGWDELGYHFVIGNGSNTPDGAVEVGSRWARQKHGAHAATPSRRFNEHGIGVCLVGDFEPSAGEPGGEATGDPPGPTPAQWASAVRLCAFLCGEFAIPPDRIIGHRDAQAAEGEVRTTCPGRLDLPALRRDVAARLAEREQEPEQQGQRH